MNRRFRLRARRGEGFSKYLKPGELAKLRDLKINSRSRRLLAVLSANLAMPLSIDQQPPPRAVHQAAQILAFERIPEFVSPIRGPRCFGRKLVAAKKSYAVFQLGIGGLNDNTVDVPDFANLDDVNADSLVR